MVIFLSFPEIDRLHEYPSSPKVMYKSVMRRVLRRHRREIPDKLFGETDPFRHRRRKSHSPHICNAIMQKVYKALRSSKNYTSRIQEVKKRFGCKKEPRMPMSVIKTTTARSDAMQMQKFVTVMLPPASQLASRLLEVWWHALGVVVAPHLARRALGASFGLAVAAAAAFPDGCHGCGAAASGAARA
jgi:hypothetical protein